MRPLLTSTTSRASPRGAAERKAMATGSMSILDAMADPNLFGPHIKGESWQPWKAFLAGLFGLEMTPEQLTHQSVI